MVRISGGHFNLPSVIMADGVGRSELGASSHPKYFLHPGKSRTQEELGGSLFGEPVWADPLTALPAHIFQLQCSSVLWGLVLMGLDTPLQGCLLCH